MNQSTTSQWVHRLAPVVLIGALIGLVYVILQPFFASIAWAVLLAYITWPLYRRFRARLGEKHNLSALLTVIGLTIVLVLPMLWLISLVQSELIRLYLAGADYLRQPQFTLPDFVTRIPWLNELLQSALTRISDPALLKQHIAQLVEVSAAQMLALLGGVGRNTAKLTFATIALFFFYRDGEAIQHQIQKALHHVIGSRADAYLRAAGKMSRVIVESAVLSALLQGLVAGLGYWVIGVKAPALFGLATAIASVIPFFGTVLIWVPVSISLFATGNLWQGLAMLAWGIILVHPIDNIIRPLFISNAARIPFLLTMFGALGGIAAFGLIGLFIGPMVLAVAIAIWREWMNAIPNETDHAEDHLDY
jgi:predicted PurR-regulated permease PerM